jgi:hypothetical protein
MKVQNAVSNDRVPIPRPPICCLVLLVALVEADLHILGQIGGDHVAELCDVLAVDLLRESKGSVDDLVVEREEALCDLVGTRVLRVEASDEYSRITVIIKLEVDGTLGEHCALKEVELAGDLWAVSLANDETVLEDVAEADVLSTDDGEELGSTRVYVRCVDTAGLHEAESGRYSEASEDRESLDVLYSMLVHMRMNLCKHNIQQPQ